jgi:hypothetical protein
VKEGKGGRRERGRTRGKEGEEKEENCTGSSYQILIQGSLLIHQETNNSMVK